MPDPPASVVVVPRARLPVPAVRRQAASEPDVEVVVARLTSVVLKATSLADRYDGAVAARTDEHLRRVAVLRSAAAAGRRAVQVLCERET